MVKPVKSTKPKNTVDTNTRGIALYHYMLVSENFERATNRILSILQEAEQKYPGRKRHLFIDVQGHRNSLGGYDNDAYELITSFVIDFLSPYLSEIHTPLIYIANPKEQNNDIPDQLLIESPNGKPLVRDESPVTRSSRPSNIAISEYLDEDIKCFICWNHPIERAHAVPASLGGSNDVRNFIFLCKKHHQAAPDVKDPEAFWDWIDWQLDEGGFFKSKKYRKSDDHFELIKEELIMLYQWKPEEIDTMFNSDLLKEYFKIISSRTSTHFGVKQKSSTDAWAFNQARINLTKISSA